MKVTDISFELIRYLSFFGAVVEFQHGLKVQHLMALYYDCSYRRRSSEPSYHPIFGQIFDFEIFNHFDSGHSVQHIVKFSVSNLV